MKRIVQIIGLFSIIFAFFASAQYPDDDRFDVPYVPTPQPIVEEMLAIAQVSVSDTLIDLGCGDGRIVLTAAQKYHTHAIGIDINPKRIAESMANAERSEIADRVTFIEQDLFNADISSATVVTMYLLHTVNLRLRPILFEQLQPGTRVVSHDFSMSEWEPDIRVSFSDTGRGTHTVYYWVIPANVSGIWQWDAMITDDTSQPYTLLIKQAFQKLTGILVTGTDSIAVHDLLIDGTELTFSLPPHSTGSSTCKYSGEVTGDTIQGYLKSDQSPDNTETPWIACRISEPQQRIDLE